MDEYIITSAIKTPAGVAVTIEACDLSDKREFLLSEECFYALHFSEGDTVSASDADILEEEAEFCKAFAAAVNILSYSAKSSTALERKLCQKGFSKNSAVRAAEHTVALGLLDEKKQAENIADYCIRHKYWGKKRIAADLMSKGYSKTAVTSALDEIDEEVYTENLGYLLEKKPIPRERAARDKYIASLCRMGYSLAEILRAIKISEQETE